MWHWGSRPWSSRWTSLIGVLSHKLEERQISSLVPPPRLWPSMWSSGDPVRDLNRRDSILTHGIFLISFFSVVITLFITGEKCGGNDKNWWGVEGEEGDTWREVSDTNRVTFNLSGTGQSSWLSWARHRYSYYWRWVSVEAPPCKTSFYDDDDDSLIFFFGSRRYLFYFKKIPFLFHGNYTWKKKKKEGETKKKISMR